MEDSAYPNQSSYKNLLPKMYDDDMNKMNSLGLCKFKLSPETLKNILRLDRVQMSISFVELFYPLLMWEYALKITQVEIQYIHLV